MQTRNSYRQRHGFTLVELLIVIAIIGTLMALLLPAVNAARERARQLTCSTNLGQLAKATFNLGTKKGDFPGWIQQQKLATNVADQYDDGNGGNQPIDLAISWAARLLPELDQGALWEQLISNSNNVGGGFDGNKGAAGVNNGYDAPPLVEVFFCPSDVRPSADIGYLSYIANTGTSDLEWANDGGQNDSKFNGVFQNLLRNGASAVRFGTDIKDGSNTTLLLSENIHKDDATSGTSYAHTWLSTPYLFSGAEPLRAEQAFGMIWIYDGNANEAAINNPPTNQFARFNQTQGYTGNFIDASALGKPFARPASSHPELFIAAFVEGNTRSINANIEYRVYQQLMTPRGNKAVYPNLDNAGNSDMRNVFMLRPLSDADY